MADSSDVFSYESMYFCDTINQAFDKISDVYLENIQHVNSIYDDVINEVNNDTLLFLSSRKWKTTDKKSLSNNQYPFRMYRCNNVLNERVMLNFQSFGDGLTATDLEDNEIFFSKTEPKLNDSFSNRTAIYRFKRQFFELSKPQKFGFDNDSSSFGHPNLSPDGNFFFFVSDMPGGFGGMDIYMCKKLGNKWSSPINLGNGVNTVYNELFPFYFGQGVLFFSSNGHAGLGGYDVFTTVLKKEKWTNATNLSVPINSKSDDLSLRCDKTKKIFYLFILDYQLI